ncbi:AP2/ERF and B3 domain-containing transcription factor At1g50680 [Linum perenne]
MFRQDPRLLAFVEVSDSNSSTRRQLDNPSTPAANNKRTTCASRFKGVVPQQNGHWGCQIYANHQRIWLGTFKSEEEAAMAYDSAALKLRSGETRRNFPVTPITAQEPTFQTYFTTESVLNMLKDGTYASRFAEFIMARAQAVGTELSLNIPRPRTDNRGMMCKQLFQKELTPSDVSKLNRLVIPKKYAVRYFPRVPEVEDGAEKEEDDDNVVLSFYDRSMKTLWRFRYCYWKSSQSFVFTRGWNRFVRENRLEAKDTVTFCLCERRNGATSETFFMIDVAEKEQPPRQVCNEIESVDEKKGKGIKLFGVRIG